MSNQMMVIFPYLYEGTWVFDDRERNLEKEPFVCGIPEMINIMTKDIADANSGFRMLFSFAPFPDYQVELVYLREEFGGNWYYWEKYDLEGWLCPAMFKYFENTPKKIYCKAEKI
ncbi:MAG: hypothetical protein QNJ32_06775 [Xenococcaceae cyanobacterium MO_167.B27]|nr:hypothetical protein [Xenococcaceae cyanobacterium MO_167.B27]